VGYRRTSLALGVVLAACTDLSGLAGSQDGVDAGKTPRDAGSSADTSTSLDSGAAPLGPRCDSTKAFEPPELVTAFDPTAEYVKDAVRSRDELEVFYLRYQGSGNWDLRHARRATREADWGTPVTEGIAPTPDGTLSLTAGDLRLYFWTIGANYRTTRATREQPFAMPAQFDVASGPQAFFVAADDTAYFAKLEGDAGFERFIKRASVNSSGFSLSSTTVPNIHVTSGVTSDSHPVLDTSETVMYFASNRPGGKGLDDIWVTRRPSKQTEFGAPTHVPELSTDEPDAVTWVAEDECELYLFRASHVYIARRGK